MVCVSVSLRLFLVGGCSIGAEVVGSGSGAAEAEAAEDEEDEAVAAAAEAEAGRK
jgi:hypothetical protein